MTHELEHANGRWSFAFVGERSAIWHRLGQQASADWSVDDWMRESGQNFTVRKVPLFAIPDVNEPENTCEIATHEALQREDNGAIVSIVSKEWKPAQNSDAYAFMRPLMDAGFCTIDTAGVLYDGRRCFVLAKTKEGFTLPGGDETEGYLLCQISHEYGIADLVLPTSVRVVCKNTLQMALDAKTQAQLNDGRFVHRAKTAFSVQKAEVLIEAYRLGLATYAEKAMFLSTKRATQEQTRAYVNKVFRLQELKEGTPEQKENRRRYNEGVIQKLLETVQTQPGAEMSCGSWWSAFHAVTYHEDHGRWNDENKEPIASKLYGTSSARKVTAFKTALEMAQ